MYTDKKITDKIKTTDSVIVGGGPIAMSVSAMMAEHGIEHTVIYPDQHNEAHPYSSQIGQYRQFSSFNNLPAQTLMQLSNFYKKHTSIKTTPIESVLVFRSKEDFDAYDKKFRGKNGITVAKLKDLPISSTMADDDVSFYPKALIQKKGAFNIEMSSFMNHLKEVSQTKATHINGKAQNISSHQTEQFITTEDGQTFTCKNALIAAGPYTGELMDRNHSRISPDAAMLHETYDIHCAPTASFDLPKDSPLHQRPMNVEFIDNGTSRAFGIYEGDTFRVSLFDLDRDFDTEQEKPISDQKKLSANRSQIAEIHRYMLDQNINPGENARLDQELARLHATNEKISGYRKTFKSMKELPTKVAEEEAYYLEQYASTVGIETSPTELRIAPYTTTSLGVPVIGRMIKAQDATPKGHGIQVAFAGLAGAYKHAFGPDIFTCIGGVAFHKMYEQAYGKEPPRLAQFNYRRGDNFYETTEPRNHIAAAMQQAGREYPYTLGQDVIYYQSGSSQTK